MRRLPPFLFALGLLSLSVHAEPAPQCAGPDVLFRPGEELTQYRTPAARVSVPPVAAAGPAVTGALSGSIRSVALPPGDNRVALTFDLCETGGEIAGYDGRIVDVLRQYHAKATFFAGGHWLLTHPARSRELLSDPLFEIGSHSWSHRDLATADAATIARELGAPQGALAELTSASPAACRPALPRKLTLFRFPYGCCSKESLAAANAAGWTVIQWSLVSGDPDRNSTAREIADRVLRRAKPGAIIVMHANGHGWNTGEAMPLILAGLAKKALTTATVSDLLAAGTPVSSPTCYGEKPGDFDRGPAVNISQ